jgi:hypothetical protein
MSDFEMSDFFYCRLTLIKRIPHSFAAGWLLTQKEKFLNQIPRSSASGLFIILNFFIFTIFTFSTFLPILLIL